MFLDTTSDKLWRDHGNCRKRSSFGVSVNGAQGDQGLTACYIAVTALFYDLSKPVNRSLPLLVTLANLLRSAGRALLHRVRYKTLRQLRFERRTP